MFLQELGTLDYHSDWEFPLASMFLKHIKNIAYLLDTIYRKGYTKNWWGLQ